jgi:hypothetical protein
LFTALILLTRAILQFHPVTVSTGLNGAPPVFVVEITIDSAMEPVRKRSFGTKVEFVRQLIGAGGIPPILPSQSLTNDSELTRARP